MKSEVMLAVKDVEKSSAWYQQALGLKSAHGGSDFEFFIEGDEIVLMLHRLSAEEHPGLLDSGPAKVGLGVLLFFHVDDVDAAHRRATEMGAELLDAPHHNEQARQYEFSLRDPDGYALTICRRSAWSG